MQRAFIFDLDGVLIDNETLWEQYEKRLYRELFGNEVSSSLGPTMGISLDLIYKRAVQLGAKLGRADFDNALFAVAPEIYRQAPLTGGIDRLVRFLEKQGFSLAVVSASPEEWVRIVIGRLAFEDKFQVVISLHDSPQLQHKPSPDGYVEVMRLLGIDAAHTAILEDSNAGIRSAKAAGAFTIALGQNIPKGYEQIGADAYAPTTYDVIKIIKNWQPNTTTPAR